MHPGSADAPGIRLLPLKGDRTDQWSIRVSGRWRVVFRFEDGKAVYVNRIDYYWPNGCTDHERHCEGLHRPMQNSPHPVELIRKSMDDVGWNVAQTAPRLGCKRGTLPRPAHCPLLLSS